MNGFVTLCLFEWELLRTHPTYTKIHRPHLRPPASPSRVSGLNFVDFPAKTWLRACSELFVHAEPITFVVDYGPPSPSLFWSKRDGLYPALRVNKAHSEASPLLYSNNRFRFPDILTSTLSVMDSPHIALFLRQIGFQASLIRYISHIKNLKLIRDTCTSIATLEILLHLDGANYALDDLSIGAEALDLLDTRFKAIPSLKEIIVNFQVYSSEDLSDLIKKIRDCGWTAEVTKLPKKVWISDDDRVEFDNEENCNAYNNEQPLFNWQRAQEKEDE